MSSKLDIEALYAALHIHLGGLCEGRVFPDIAPADAAYPVVTYGIQGGGEENRRRRENSTLVLVVKCIATKLEDAFAVARQIRDLLRDQGSQESDTLPHDSDWDITTVSQGLLMHMVETWKDGRMIYHTGHQYTFTMELKS